MCVYNAMQFEYREGLEEFHVREKIRTLERLELVASRAHMSTLSTIFASPSRRDALSVGRRHPE
jgi:hypothetical protein